MFDNEDDLNDLLEQMNEVARKGWHRWRQSYEGQQPAVAYMLMPGEDKPFTAVFEVLEHMPGTLEERVSTIANLGYKASQQFGNVQVFFLMQEAWSAQVDSEEDIPDGPVKSMDESVEVLVASGLTYDGTMMIAEQPINGDDLGDCTRNLVTDEVQAPLVEAFWEGYSQGQN